MGEVGFSFKFSNTPFLKIPDDESLLSCPQIADCPPWVSSNEIAPCKLEVTLAPPPLISFSLSTHIILRTRTSTVEQALLRHSFHTHSRFRLWREYEREREAFCWLSVAASPPLSSLALLHTAPQMVFNQHRRREGEGGLTSLPFV